MEKSFKPMSGYLYLFLALVILALSVFSFTRLMLVPGIIGIVLFILIMPGFLIVAPNESAVLVLFGAYKGTVKANGFWWANPFFTKEKISLRARNIDSDPIKVNDKIGNPVMIGVVVVWKVENTYKAAFEVDNYEQFVDIQSEAAIRKLAGYYPYDNFEDEDAEITLRGGGEEVNDLLEQELMERLSIAGIKIHEARINYLAYASEIAGAMLRRQQATAIVAARTKVVEGAVGMVKLALDELKEKDIIELDDERKASMVSNLMVVLCSDEAAQPVLNAGSLY
ncbi:SPFH domain-containing protein [Prolixibacter denitrificans]|uniref:Regulator of protease activity HflC (Stomatin/prohibitin superfamily) n=1 Tax=Prolixibacter denitrificans TaxID=1541063 RepID=A0A2P8CG28_9BACT|nr:SPFH domain-containing protein [Prolixibacter denitrificans]PSK83906.1 regulator of protease activity HflC (stomatin/prohibitin superfamily) [Prolixibacter denitrificans]GET23447.1 hypothetical protein JCM18694_36930 [Prolixibacter denitrificans]